MEYTEKDLVKIAKRENNTKRNYLVVDPLQGKHIPVVPSKALDLFAALADTFREKYKDEKLLLVGFAETATAIAKTCKGKGCKRKTAERIQRAKRETSQRKDG